jgi:hypothetical protein
MISTPISLFTLKRGAGGADPPQRSDNLRPQRRRVGGGAERSAHDGRSVRGGNGLWMRDGLLRQRDPRHLRQRTVHAPRLTQPPQKTKGSRVDRRGVCADCREALNLHYSIPWPTLPGSSLLDEASP